MLERVLVPLDGSLASESIVHTLSPVFTRARSSLLLLHVQNPREGPPRGLRGDTVHARSYLETLSRCLGDRGISARPIVRTGPAGKTTLDVARQEGASLIALTNRGALSPPDSTLGPVTREILLRSPVPVLALRAKADRASGEGPDEGIRTYERILLPLPGVGAHQSVLTLAREVARVLGAKLDLLRVLEPELREAPQDGHLAQLEAMEELARAAQEFERSGIRAVATIAHGPPVEAILSQAASSPRTAVLMGTPETGEIRKLLLGRITARVFHEAEVPVFVFSPGGCSEDGEEPRVAG
jgi:nucleotide-binding universal stress UspA family protein